MLVSFAFSGLDWTGLDWARLGWAGLGWGGQLGWAVLGWAAGSLRARLRKTRNYIEDAVRSQIHTLYICPVLEGLGLGVQGLGPQ